MAAHLVPTLFSNLKYSVDMAINQSPSVSLSCDGWTDIQRNEIVNTMVHTPIPYLYESVDTKMNPQMNPHTLYFKIF